MKASDIRGELLQQHTEIRALLGEACAVAERRQGAAEGREELPACLSRLAEAVRRHNRREHELLRDILPTVDAWGPARTEIMLEEHAREDEEILATLTAAKTATDAAVAARLLADFADRMREHMAREEKIFLAEDVLHDEHIVKDYFGG